MGIGQAIAASCAVTLLVAALWAGIYAIGTPDPHTVVITRCHISMPTHDSTCTTETRLVP